MSDAEVINHLTVRGKNIYFLEVIADLFDLNHLPRSIDSFWGLVDHLKRAITPEIVKELHQAVIDLWPSQEDLSRCLDKEKDNYSGLFLGHYLVDVTVNLLNRHALYNESIILIDPFLDPRRLKAEFNPIEKPEQFVTTTFHYVLLWLQLAPWIYEGIIKIVRDPSDFDSRLKQQTKKIVQERHQLNPSFERILNEYKENSDIEQIFTDALSLGYDDEYLIREVGSCIGVTPEEILEFIEQKRRNSFYYIHGHQKKQNYHWSTGTNYEMGKLICDATNSHIITDISYRWEEIRFDRVVNNIEINDWSNFSKAFQEAPIKHLDGLMFSDLLRLRKDGHLESMRAFLRKSWRSCTSGDPFSKNDVDNLHAELFSQLSLAEIEWRKIDSNLLKWFGSESIIGTTIGVATGQANWLPAMAVAAAGGLNIALSTYERKTFMKKYPAGFFIDKIRKNT
jgi:hypothetical protein